MVDLRDLYECAKEFLFPNYTQQVQLRSSFLTKVFVFVITVVTIFFALPYFLDILTSMQEKKENIVKNNHVKYDIIPAEQKEIKEIKEIVQSDHVKPISEAPKEYSCENKRIITRNEFLKEFGNNCVLRWELPESSDDMLNSGPSLNFHAEINEQQKSKIFVVKVPEEKKSKSGESIEPPLILWLFNKLLSNKVKNPCFVDDIIRNEPINKKIAITK
jgi:hypothetical protein